MNWNITFQFQNNNEIAVLLLNTTTNVITSLVYNTDFTVTPNVSPVIGGTITIQPNAASGIANSSGQFPAGYTLTIIPNIALTQSEAFPDTGPFPTDDVEFGLDRLTLIVQQISNLINNSLQIPSTDSGITTELVSANARKNLFLGFDNNGNPIATAGPITGISPSSAMIPVIQAATLALARTALGLGGAAVLGVGAGLQSSGGNLVWDFTTEATVASASTADLGAASSNVIDVTGTVTINSFGSSANTNNPLYFVRFTGILQLTYNATSMILPGAANITTAAGDYALMKYEGSGNWRCLSYQRAGVTSAQTKLVTDGTQANVASAKGSFTTGHLLSAADSNGTVQDGGSVSSNQIQSPGGVGSEIWATSTDSAKSPGATTSAANLSPVNILMAGASSGWVACPITLTGIWQYQLGTSVDAGSSNLVTKMQRIS